MYKDQMQDQGRRVLPMGNVVMFLSPTGTVLYRNTERPREVVGLDTRQLRERHKVHTTA